MPKKIVFFLLTLVAASFSSAQAVANESEPLFVAMMCQEYVNFFPRIADADLIAIRAEDHMEALIDAAYGDYSENESAMHVSNLADAAYLQVITWDDDPQEGSESLWELGEACKARYAN